ncbi:hypothetical protein [Mariprofundus ferrooxydans]|uniref:hypothetical protein n=1 Tax=Mariprofundus ferrooxydans TaxID=314344 RepID=UPI0012DF3A42|nr:hypothetical protein [Mariprofundus ferrooxydans]
MSVEFSNPEFLQATTPDGTARTWYARFNVKFGNQTLKALARTPEMQLDDKGIPIPEGASSSPFKDDWILIDSDSTDNTIDIYNALFSNIYENQYGELLPYAADGFSLGEWLENELKKTCLYPVSDTKDSVYATSHGNCDKTPEESIQKRSQQEIDRSNILSGLRGVYNKHKKYHNQLPAELNSWYCYLTDCGHSILAILSRHEDEAFSEKGKEGDFLCPMPVKAVLGYYRIRNGYIVVDNPNLSYDPILGLIGPDALDEF